MIYAASEQDWFGARYFVISDNTYNVFDIETPRREVGYQPIHNAEEFYR